MVLLILGCFLLTQSGCDSPMEEEEALRGSFQVKLAGWRALEVEGTRAYYHDAYHTCLHGSEAMKDFELCFWNRGSLESRIPGAFPVVLTDFPSQDPPVMVAHLELPGEECRLFGDEGSITLDSTSYFEGYYLHGKIDMKAVRRCNGSLLEEDTIRVTGSFTAAHVVNWGEPPNCPTCDG